MRKIITNMDRQTDRHIDSKTDREGKRDRQKKTERWIGKDKN